MVILVLVDGLFISEHEELINYNANKIKKISFVSGKYFYGTKVFDGILSFETVNGDYEKNLPKAEKSYYKKLNLFQPQRQKNYFKQKYLSDVGR